MLANLKYKDSYLWVWVISIAFVALNALALYFEFFYLPLIPVVLLFVIVAFTRLDILLYVIVFFAPLSLELSELKEGLGIDLYLPTEPLLAGLLVIFILRYFRGYRSDRKFLRHPVTLAIYFHLAWMAITIVTSSDPLVSIKYFVTRLWFIIGFYIVAVEVFRKEKNMQRYVWLYVISFSIVIVYTLARHSVYGLNNQMMAHSMMQPFFNDHTSYGASLALVIPVLIGMTAITRKDEINSRVLIFMMLIFYSAATVFSYTRAAWVSLAGAFGIWAIIKLRIRFELVILGAGILIGLFFVFKPMIMLELEDNRTKSSGDLAEHIQSISNISNDQSNLERINRWSCAVRMWKDKPLYGFGPGTYQFQYAPYQLSYEKTEISTDFGVRGTAHSEYLGPLSESGVFGLLSVLLIILTTIFTGIRVIYESRKKTVRLFALSVLVGLTTYYIHGILNNFLDTDKASALFWGYTAMLVAMDVYHRKKGDEEANPEIQHQ